ncbi:hypothetical protein SAMN05216303_106286 [Rhodoferax sp. OV413]|uniref:DUF1439 domain-containing protein n=1 Tax=Rhodoferax sp. OV413 TaxID=1855285 RepID=UPI00088BCC5F|nr:DUF1439 domain-containing protein [Rhodoferax sp. OV413]SDP72669.1 hypothetical protein SAMN05216303_106286 [Rhodoferax sp. OV413]
MQRRYLLVTSARLALLGAGVVAMDRVLAQPSYTVSAQVLQQTVAQRFPLRYPVEGLLNLDLQAPRLSLLPVQNRLAAAMQVEAAGPALRRSYTGSFDVDFALRYEASDRSIRAYQLQFKNLQFPGLQPAAAELLNAYGPALAAQSLQEVVLHTLRPQDLTLADTMGLQPGSITVTDKGLVVGFVNKPG